ncbi:MAG: T9SS type A sorting domain-containing protein [Mangrovimonas sp.]|nr:T9SS type A sorting domain-containing protein [Mangrovimonas sp.]
MKTRLLSLFFLGAITLNAQTTYNLDWFAGVGSNVDLTIQTGDTVTWTWTSPNHTVENDPSGSSVETFNSGFLGPTGSTFSHTFTVIGSNDYYCGIHGAASMSGTITVEALSVDEFTLKNFKISPNPVIDKITLELPERITEATIEVYDILGKRVYAERLENLTSHPEINVLSWNKGIYLVKVASGNSVETKKFVKF